jgi:hypothetical protein
LKKEIEYIRSDPEIHVLSKVSELGDMSISKLTQLHSRLTSDLRELSKVRTSLLMSFEFLNLRWLSTVMSCGRIRTLNVRKVKYLTVAF